MIQSAQAAERLFHLGQGRPRVQPEHRVQFTVLGIVGPKDLQQALDLTDEPVRIKFLLPTLFPKPAREGICSIAG